MKLNFNLKKTSQLINPQLKAGGLHIADGVSRYFWLENGLAKKHQISIPSGIIVNGKVINEASFIGALRELRLKISRNKKRVPVVVSLSAANIYMQVFNMPLVAPEEIEETAHLNLQINSPIDSRSAYYDWEAIGNLEQSDHEVGGRGQLEALGAFANASVIDVFSRCLEQAGFLVVAIEPMPLSLMRMLKDNFELDANQPHVLFALSEDGMDFAILRHRAIHFNYFISWSSIRESVKKEQIETKDFQEVATADLRRVQNFYTSRWGGGVNSLILVSDNFTKEIVPWLEKDLGFVVTHVQIPKYADLGVNWWPAIGAALRGALARSLDTFISLATVGTEEEFMRSRILYFLSIWRNVILTTLVVVILAYLTVDLLFVRAINSIDKQIMRATNDQARIELNQLQERAKQFNALVDKAFIAKSNGLAVSPFIKKIYSLAGTKVDLTEVKITSGSLTISISGTANTEQSVIDFKNTLEKDGSFANINLPLSAITSLPDGRAAFSTTFQLVKNR